jgi:hypothetical protein
VRGLYCCLLLPCLHSTTFYPPFCSLPRPAKSKIQRVQNTQQFLTMAFFLSSIKRKLISILPFSYDCKQHVDDEEHDNDDRQQRPSKRQRTRGAHPPPNLVSETDFFCDDETDINKSIDDTKHPSSRRRKKQHHRSSSSPSSTSPLLRLLPNDALSHCLST